jgi:N-dimethylarginine dimethylaminohydrolase
VAHDNSIVNQGLVMTPRQKILMCAPTYFGVDYVINPWMINGLGQTNNPLAQVQWDGLRHALTPHADLIVLDPQRNLPDMVFTANAGMVLGHRVIVSRFHVKERQGEEPFFHAWFLQNNFEILAWPDTVAFEGAGDALLDRQQGFIWVANGFRSDKAAALYIEKALGRPTVKLTLVDPRFYHLDTCLCPLEGGYVMYYPPAFDEQSQQTIAAVVPPEKRIIVCEKDGLSFACNAVDVNRYVIMNDAEADLQAHLRTAGFIPIITPLTEFMKSGGAAKCLTLKLIEN